MNAAENLHAWRSVLDHLERDVAATEDLLRSPEAITAPLSPTPWESPVLDGPLPDELLARARDLHHRQCKVREALAVALDGARSRRLEARRAVGLSASPRTVAPAYVDVSA